MFGRIPLVAMSLTCLIVSGCGCCSSGHRGLASGPNMARMFNSPIFGSQNGNPDHCGHCSPTGQYGEPSCGVMPGDDQCSCETAWTCNAPAAAQNYPCAACANSCGEGCGVCSQQLYQHQAAPSSALQVPASPTAPQIQVPPMPVPAETPEGYNDASAFDARDIRRTNWAAKDTRIMLPGKMVSHRELRATATSVYPTHAPPIPLVPAEGI